MQQKITMDGLIAQLASPTPWIIKHSGACAWQVFDANGVMIMSFLDGPINTANVRLIVDSVNNAAQQNVQADLPACYLCEQPMSWSEVAHQKCLL